MKKLLTLIFIGLLFGSCIKEFTDTLDKTQKINSVKWNPELAVPLVYSRLHILDTAASIKFIELEDDGSLTAVYADVIFSKTAEEAIPLTNQSFAENLVLNAGQLALLNSAGQVNINYSRDFTLSYGGNEVDRILFKNGEIQFNVSSSLQHNVSVRIKAPNAIKQTVSLDQNLNANYSGTLPVVGSSIIPLNGYDVDFTQTPQGHSEIQLDIEVTITKQGSNPIGGAENINISFDLVNQEFQQLYGYMNTLDLTSGSEDISINVYDGDNAGSFTLADPRAKMIFGNSMGIDIDATIIQFDGVSKSNNTVSLTGYPSPLPIPTPLIGDLGTMLYDSFELNQNNSNIVDYVNNQPKDNFFDLTIQTNPGLPTERNWFLDTSRIEVEAQIALPFHGTASNYNIESESEFDLGIEDDEFVEEILIRLHTENGFPIDVTTQVYFEDSITNTILDSLLTTDVLILPSGNIDGNGKVTSPNPKTTDIVYDKDRIDKIIHANRIRTVASLNTTTISGAQPDVKIFKEYEILLQLGIQAKLLLNEQL
jgi:hypothetical protein